MVATQLYLSNYLDSRFRPGVQIDPKTIDDFTRSRLCRGPKPGGKNRRRWTRRRDFIQEALVQRGINDQADQWLIESKARLHIEKFSTRRRNEAPEPPPDLELDHSHAVVLAVIALLAVVVFFGSGAGNPLLSRLLVSRLERMTGGKWSCERCPFVGWRCGQP